jgi:hypothetical protein
MCTIPATNRFGETVVETHGPLGVLWTGLGLIAFYIALIWLNTLLAVFLTPLFMIPGTWLMDFVKVRKTRKQQSQATRAS